MVRQPKLATRQLRPSPQPYDHEGESLMRTQVMKKRTIRRALANALGLTLAVLAAMPASAQHSPSTVYQPTLDRISTFVVGNNGRL